MSQQCALTANSRLMVSWAMLDKVLPEGQDPCSTLVWPHVECQTQFCAPHCKRSGLTRVNPAKGHKDVERTGVPLLWGDAERAGTFRLEKRSLEAYQCL